MTNLLREGMRAAIPCQILEGDLPVTFRWERNGQPLNEQSLGASTRRLDEYSTSLIIEHITSSHSGNYTCVAQNVAGSESFPVPLTVNGKVLSLISCSTPSAHNLISCCLNFSVESKYQQTSSRIVCDKEYGCYMCCP